jgi:hypothetical protein
MCYLKKRSFKKLPTRTYYAARGLLPRHRWPRPAEENEEDATELLGAAPSSDSGLFVHVLFAAQYDDPEKQDRQHGTNDSYH